MKDVLIYFGIVIGGILLVCLLIWLLVRKKHVLFSSLSGVLGLVLVNLTGAFTGVAFGYTILSVGSAAILGLPGIALLLIFRLI